MNGFLLLALLAGVGAILWRLYKPAALFVIRIRSGQPMVASGVVTPLFLSMVTEICAEHKIQSGEIRGVARDYRIALWFSYGLPKSFCQRLRNWWSFSGWPARPRTPGRGRSIS